MRIFMRCVRQRGNTGEGTAAMIELLSPAGSMEALRAAVQNGANAVYLGYDAFNARMGARNFSVDVR